MGIFFPMFCMVDVITTTRPSSTMAYRILQLPEQNTHFQAWNIKKNKQKQKTTQQQQNLLKKHSQT